MGPAMRYIKTVNFGKCSFHRMKATPQIERSAANEADSLNKEWLPPKLGSKKYFFSILEKSKFGD